jgi:hypothetical protein
MLYSTVGLSLYPNPMISGIINLKYLDRRGTTGNHLSADAPIPCNSRSTSLLFGLSTSEE